METICNRGPESASVRIIIPRRPQNGGAIGQDAPDLVDALARAWLAAPRDARNHPG